MRLASEDRFIPAPAGNSFLESGTLRAACFPTVHPRACGETDRRVASLMAQVGYYGSSPRLRGTVPVREVRPATGRFIPAPAGKQADWKILELRGLMDGSSPRLRGTDVLQTHGRQALDTVHPRACGEQTAGTAPNNTNAGSSPRLRGTGKGTCLALAVFRFIPAPAGNRSGRGDPPWGMTVHPRACGEQLLA